MASRRDEGQDYSYCHLLLDASPVSEQPPSASWWTDREEHMDREESLRDQLTELDEHVARLQDTLACERVKSSRLQLQLDQQHAELQRRELLSNRLKEKLSQLLDRPKERGFSLELLNPPPGGRSRRDPLNKPLRFPARREEAALRLMLERREAELREAMKLRHRLTTLLHALRVDMQQSLSDPSPAGDEKLDQTEAALGEHVTGGVVQSWRLVQKKLQDWGGQLGGQLGGGAGTDQDKILAQLEAELRGSQQLVRLQQQLLQDSLASPLPAELSDSYFLEEWERLQMSWGELQRQKKTFETERQNFTEAAIRLSHERRDFEHQKASLVQQQYLRGSSPVRSFSRGGVANMSGCLPVTPSSSADSATRALPGLPEGPAVRTPSTPQLYAALNMSDGRSRRADHPAERWDGGARRRVCTPWAQHMDVSF